MKVLRRIVIIAAIVVGLLYLAFQFMKTQTKKHSPEDTVEYVQGDLSLSVTYSRPYKKGRVIFGELVPYGEVWRTGANEATTFTTSKDLTIDGKTLPAGDYTLWTIPNQDSWNVIFNNKQYGWGVNFSAEASRDPEADVVNVQVPVEKMSNVTEQFTIAFEDGEALKMTLAWDEVKVAVAMRY